MEYQHSELTGQIIAAAIEVHKQLGNGFQELIFHKALTIELNSRNIKSENEVSIPVYYKEIQIGYRRVDFLVDKAVCVEIKALSQLENQHLAQALNYLEALNLEIGLLINFGASKLEIKRLYNKKYKPNITTK